MQNQLFDERLAEVTVNADAKTIILYHGSRVPYKKVMKQGLLIRAGLRGKNSKLQMIDDVLNGEFGVTREQIPEWIWKFEYDYEKTIEPHLHLSINLGTAVGYSHQGCEIKAQIRDHMYGWLLIRRYGDLSVGEMQNKFPKSNLSQLACEQNGKRSYVFQVAVPKSFIRKEDLKFWSEIINRLVELQKKRPELNALRHLLSDTIEMRCVKNLPASQILRIWNVDWKHRWSSFYDNTYQLKLMYAANSGER